MTDCNNNVPETGVGIPYVFEVAESESEAGLAWSHFVPHLKKNFQDDFILRLSISLINLNYYIIIIIF